MSDVESFVLKRRFHCDPGMVFALLTEAHYIQGYTRCKAVSEPCKDGKYDLFDGNITGFFVEADKAAGRIVLKWKLRNWAVDAISTVTIQISASGAFKVLKRKSTNRLFSY